MAIKGKKKSKGAAGARRPAGAPRPVIQTNRRKASFWRTRDGILILAVFVLVAIGVVVWLVSSAQNEAAKKDERRTVVSQYTDQVQPILRDVGDAAEEMAALQVAPTVAELADAAKSAEGWNEAFQNAQVMLSQTFPSGELTGTNELFTEAMALYGNAATFLSTIDDLNVTDAQRSQLFANFAAQRDLATAMIGSAISTFDQLRSELGMSRSGLQPPVSMTAPPEATPEPGITVSPPAPDESGDQQDQKNKKDGKGSDG